MTKDDWRVAGVLTAVVINVGIAQHLAPVTLRDACCALAGAAGAAAVFWAIALGRN